MMARARNIKPGFFENEDLAELGPYAMLLFEALWCLADREGRLEDRPRRIKAKALPYFDVDVDALLTALHQAGFIRRYTVGDRPYIQVVTFTLHQKPHVRENPSTIPPEPGGAEIQPNMTQAMPGHDLGNGESALIPDCLIADSGLSDSSETEGAPAARDEPPFSPGFLAFWGEWRTGVTNGHGGKTPAGAVWRRMKLDRVGPELMTGLARWKASDYWQQEGGRFVMAAERWLKERKWDDDPPAVLARASPDSGLYGAGDLEPPDPEEHAAREARRQAWAAKQTETAEQRFARLHPEVVNALPIPRS